MTETKAPLVYSAIASVMADLARTGIGKDSTNEHDRYRYRSIDAVLNALSPVLARHGLVILPNVLNREVVERTSKAGGLLLHTVLLVRFAFVAAVDGSTHEIEVFGESSDRADKGLNKALVAAYKYAVTQVFCIAYAGTDDADAVTEQAGGLRKAAPTGRARTSARPAPSPETMIAGTTTDEMAEHFADALNAATSRDGLHAVGDLIKRAPLPETVRNALRILYVDRQTALAELESDRAELDAVTGTRP